MKLKVQNLMKSYSGRKVVKDVSFEVDQGEIVGLLGPNGAVFSWLLGNRQIRQLEVQNHA